MTFEKKISFITIRFAYREEILSNLEYQLRCFLMWFYNKKWYFQNFCKKFNGGKVTKFVTAETVSPGHPDKIADLISDYVLTKALENNSSSRVAVETFLTGTKKGGLVLVGGEISEIANITTEDVINIVTEALNKTIKTSFEDFDLQNLSIFNELTPQSEEIRAAVEEIGRAHV